MKMDNCWSRCIQFSSSSLSDMNSTLLDDSESLKVNQLNVSNKYFNRKKNKNQSNVKVLKTSLLSIDNTTSGVNWSNMSENEEEEEADERRTKNSKNDSFDWNCEGVDKKNLGYQKNGEDPKLNETILNIPSKRKIKPKFTPPIFSKTGIYICPDYEEKKKDEEEASKMKPKSSRSRDDDYDNKEASRMKPKYSRSRDDGYDEEDDPGNKEFQEFNNPKVGNSCTYISYVVPDREDDWDWIYNHMKQIRHSFSRKYRANVSLCKNSVPYKGRRVHMMKIESHNQFNILRCRNGLPNRLKQMLYDAPNAIMDTECYTSEYLIKRKKIFAKINENKPEENEEDQNMSTEKSSMAQESEGYKEPVPITESQPQRVNSKDMKSNQTGDGESKVTTNKNQVNQHQQPKSKSLTKTTETRDSRKAKKMKEKVEKKKIKKEILKKKDK